MKIVIVILAALCLGMACRPVKVPLEPQPLENADVCIPPQNAELCEGQLEMSWDVVKPDGKVAKLRGKVEPGQLYSINRRAFNIDPATARTHCDGKDSEPGSSSITFAEACLGPPVALVLEEVR